MKNRTQEAADGQLGELIQAYIRARGGDRPDDAAADALRPRLDDALCERLDTLGMDAERLLRIEPERVVEELRNLERKAAAEDAGAAAAASRLRSREEQVFTYGTGGQAAGGQAMGGRGTGGRERAVARAAGRPRRPAGQGGRRQGGNR